MLEFTVTTQARDVLVDITGRIQETLDAAGFEGDGVCHIFVPHTTAGVTVNEGVDPSVRRDIEATFARLVPRDAGYLHHEGNSDAHVKTTIVGNHTAVPIQGGALKVGMWQHVYLAEFDGPRTRRVWIEVTRSALTGD